MRLLTDADLLKVKLSDSVQNLIDEYYSQWLDAEQVAQKEMASYLAQRYITASIFTDTSIYDDTVVYYAKSLVCLSADDWDENETYALDDLVLYEGKIYKSLGTPQGTLPTNEDDWEYICDNLTLFYGILPSDEWDKDTEYAIGDIVWYNNKEYTAVAANTNILPTSSAAIWGSGTAYAIPVATSPLDTDYWTRGDNRNPQIVRYLLDIAAYHFLRAVPARAVPDIIKEAYNGNSSVETGGAIGWLKNVSKGNVNADLPEIYSAPLYSIMHGQAKDKQDNQLW